MGKVEMKTAGEMVRERGRDYETREVDDQCFRTLCRENGD